MSTNHKHFTKLLRTSFTIFKLSLHPKCVENHYKYRENNGGESQTDQYHLVNFKNLAENWRKTQISR